MYRPALGVVCDCQSTGDQLRWHQCGFAILPFILSSFNACCNVLALQNTMPKRATAPDKAAAASGARADGAGGDSALPTAAAAGVRCVNFQAHASDGKSVAAKLETPAHAGARCERSRRMHSMHSMITVHMPACSTAAATSCYYCMGINAHAHTCLPARLNKQHTHDSS